jgi:hypothetical protein
MPKGNIVPAVAVAIALSHSHWALAEDRPPSARAQATASVTLGIVASVQPQDSF